MNNHTTLQQAEMRKGMWSACVRDILSTHRTVTTSGMWLLPKPGSTQLVVRVLTSPCLPWSANHPRVWIRLTVCSRGGVPSNRRMTPAALRCLQGWGHQSQKGVRGRRRNHRTRSLQCMGHTTLYKVHNGLTEQHATLSTHLAGTGTPYIIASSTTACRLRWQENTDVLAD